MAEGRNRRLSAVLMADIAGYTKLVEQDTDGTVAAWTTARENVIDPKVAAHSGRIVKHTGDGFLAEFLTVKDAVTCAIEMQEDLSSNPLDFRMGVNLGDVVDDGTDIHGEGVNIAARIEGLATPGGISVSGSVYEQVRNRVDAAFEDHGEHEVKHVSAPVRVYRIQATINDPTPLNNHQPQLAGRSTPSIAVLPFDNMSGDPEQEFFADGMAEDIITGLSRFSALSVIARNSSFSFKGQSRDIKEIAENLGVRYVLEGSVRRGGERIRVTAQLIEAETGSHLWAERYDRDLSDIFAVQDEVTGAIISAIAPEIDQTEQERSRRKPPEKLDAWDLYQRALENMHVSSDKTLKRSIEIFDEINEIDPEFAAAWGMGAVARTSYVQTGRPDQRDEILKDARAKVQTALRLDPNDPLCIFADGMVQTFLGNHDVGLVRLKEAIGLNPNHAFAHYAFAYASHLVCNFDDTLVHINRAIELSPRDIGIGRFLGILGFTHFHMGNFEEAITFARQAINSANPPNWGHVCHAMSLLRAGRTDAAKDAMIGVYERFPNFSLTFTRQALRHFDERVLNFSLDTLRDLGVPE